MRGDPRDQPGPAQVPDQAGDPQRRGHDGDVAQMRHGRDDLLGGAVSVVVAVAASVDEDGYFVDVVVAVGISKKKIY